MEATLIKNPKEIVEFVERVLCKNCFESQNGRLFYSDFYVGVTNAPERRFVEHCLRQGFCYVVALADTHKDACEAKNELLRRGMRSNSGCGNDTSVYVYAYRIHHDSCESTNSLEVLAESTGDKTVELYPCHNFAGFSHEFWKVRILGDQQIQLNTESAMTYETARSLAIARKPEGYFLHEVEISDTMPCSNWE